MVPGDGLIELQEFFRFFTLCKNVLGSVERFFAELHKVCLNACLLLKSAAARSVRSGCCR